MALPVLDQPWFLGLLILNSALGVSALIRDLKTNNPQIAGIMQAVWILTVLYSGLPGLAVYYYSGRRQIADDSVWRRGFRSVAHCYSGCGAGEIAGVTVASAIALTATAGVVALTFTLAGEATLGDVRFWSSLYISLAAGLLAAYPVNVLLIDWGVKEGMHDPRTARITRSRPVAARQDGTSGTDRIRSGAP